MVARRQGLKHGQARRHARAEGNRLYAALQIGQALFERIPIGIVDPAIEEMPGELSIRIALKCGGGVERRSDRAGGRVHMPPGVDAEGLKLLVRIRRRCHSLSLLRERLGQRLDRSDFDRWSDIAVGRQVLAHAGVHRPGLAAAMSPAHPHSGCTCRRQRRSAPYRGSQDRSRPCFRALSTSSAVTFLPPCCTLPAITSSALSFSEIGAT